MIYRFIVISDEVDDFMREIQIDSDATFFELHKAILDSCEYEDKELTSFTICENGWEKVKAHTEKLDEQAAKERAEHDKQHKIREKELEKNWHKRLKRNLAYHGIV